MPGLPETSPGAKLLSNGSHCEAKDEREDKTAVCVCARATLIWMASVPTRARIPQVKKRIFGGLPSEDTGDEEEEEAEAVRGGAVVVGVATNADATDHRAQQPSRASLGTAAQLSSTLRLVADGPRRPREPVEQMCAGWQRAEGMKDAPVSKKHFFSRCPRVSKCQ